MGPYEPGQKNRKIEIEKTDDFGTEDLLVSTLKEHEKSLWMLDSHLQKSA